MDDCKKTALNIYGINNRYSMDINGKHLELYIHLSYKEKKRCCVALYTAYLRASMIVIFDNNYLSLQNPRFTNAAHGNATVPIKGTLINTKEQKHRFLLIQIFCNDDLTRHVTSFL